MLKLKLTYPSKEDELTILNRMSAIEPKLTIEAVLGPSDLFSLRNALDQIYLDDKIKRYIVDIVHATAHSGGLWTRHRALYPVRGQSKGHDFPARAAKAQAFLDGRGYVTPQDVKSIGPDILRHRLSVTYEAEAEDITSEGLLQRIFDSLKVP